MKFEIVWEDCIQEEARVANREALLNEYDKYLETHSKRGEFNITSRRKDTRSVDLPRGSKGKEETIR